VELPLIQPLGDGVLFARPAGYHVLVMNGGAGIIWQLLADRTPSETIQSLLVDRFGITREEAARDLAALLATWRAQGLIPGEGVQQHYSLGAAGFSLGCADAALAAEVASLLGHLRCAAPATAPLRPRRLFALARDGAALVLRAEGLEICRASAPDALLERLLTEAMLHAYDSLPWFAAIHAAALGNGAGCLLLPGISGTGKTTLAATMLAGSDLAYLGDDMALLRQEDLRVEPLPGPLVLKRGSWPLLEAALPGLAATPVHQRFGEPVRYWAPPPERLAAAPLPVRAVVLPCRRPGASARLSPLGTAEGMAAILAAPATIRPPVLAATLARLAGWAEAIGFHRLEYDCPRMAVPLLRGLLPG
jgi:hypothetical protein